MGHHGAVANAARGNRTLQTVRDMILSLAVVGLVVAALLLVSPHKAQDPVKPIDYGLQFQQASRVAPYPLLGPRGLPERWRPTSADFDGADPAATTWHIGFINPGDEYVAVEQTNGAHEPFVRDKGKRGEIVGSMPIAGDEWLMYDGPKYRSLVRAKDGVTTMVTGTATFPELQVMVEALRPAPPIAG
jgi:hypothetical protein